MKKIIALILLPFAANAQVEPTGAIQAGVNFGTGLHAGVEAGVSIDRRVTIAADYTAYIGHHTEHVFGLKSGLAVIYRDSEGLCPIYLIAGASQAHYQDEYGKPTQSAAPTYGVRVQYYNGYWEVGRQNGYWGFTVGFQFRKTK